MSDVPRPEYPRPQFCRTEWVNLNGTWEFAFGGRDTEPDQWFGGMELPKRITVPYPYQCELSGINDKAIHELVWYAKSFEAKPEWEGRSVLLHFGAADYCTEVFVNDRWVGQHQGGHVPFEFDIAPYLKEGTNRILLRVQDGQSETQPRGKQASDGKTHGIDYYNTTGIWQTVWLEPVSKTRIESFRFDTVAEEGLLHVGVTLHAPGGARTIQVDVLDGKTVVASAHVRTLRATANMTLIVPDAKLWSPDSPNLYDVKLTLLEDGAVADTVDSYVGFRSIELHGGNFLLNGQPFYLKMVLDQGYWPESYLAGPSDEAIRKDVELTKALGFNGARKHQKVEDPRWIYWCDQLGLLVWGEMANARQWSREGEVAFLQEWVRAVQRDYNSPSVVVWVPINESWGTGDMNHGRPEQIALAERAVLATRAIDAYRPVVDNDGWEHTAVADLCTIHDYTHTGEQLRAKYEETTNGGPLPVSGWPNGPKTFVDGVKFSGQPILITEMGGFLTRPSDIPKEQWDGLYNAYASFDSDDELVAKYRDICEAIADLPFVCGFCYTQLTDVEQEMNGLLTYDRRPKAPVDQFARVNEGLRVKGQG